MQRPDEKKRQGIVDAALKLFEAGSKLARLAIEGAEIPEAPDVQEDGLAEAFYAAIARVVDSGGIPAHAIALPSPSSP